MLSLKFRDELDAKTVDELDQLTAGLNGVLGTEHYDDGSHAAITADSLELAFGGSLTFKGVETDGTADGVFTMEEGYLSGVIGGGFQLSTTGSIVLQPQGTSLGATLTLGAFSQDSMYGALFGVQPVTLSGTLRLNGQTTYNVGVLEQAAFETSGYEAPRYAVYHLTASGAQTIHGIIASTTQGALGQVIVLVNQSSFTITLGTGTVTNRRKILLPAGRTTYPIAAGDTVVLMYDNVGLGWRVIADPLVANAILTSLTVDTLTVNTSATLPSQTGIGGAPSTGAMLNLSGSFTGVGAGFGISVNPTITVPAGALGTMTNTAGTLVRAASGTHALFSGHRVLAPTIAGVGAATITDAVSFYVDGAPSATVTGELLAFKVNAGNSRFGGNVFMPNTALRLRGTSGAFDLVIAPGSALTGTRTFTLTTGDADRTLTLNGNATLNDWFDQSVKQAASPTFNGLSLTSLTVSGTSISVNSHTVTVNGAATLNDWFDQSVKSTASPTFAGLSLTAPISMNAQSGHTGTMSLAGAGGGTWDLEFDGGVLVDAAFTP